MSVLQCKERVRVSVRTSHWGRLLLCWMSHGTVYRQLLRVGKKTKRCECARENLGVSFEDVVWSDDSTVQLESHQCKKKARNQGANHDTSTTCTVIPGMINVAQIYSWWSTLDELPREYKFVQTCIQVLRIGNCLRQRQKLFPKSSSCVLVR